MFLAIVRNRWIAFALLCGILLPAAITSESSATWSAFARVALLAILLTRFGILVTTATGFVYVIVTNTPLTLDPSAWYFGASMTYLVVVVALAGFGGWTSLGGRPLFVSGSSEED